MDVKIKRLIGNWDNGYALDKHTIRSVPIGRNQNGRMQFNTERTQIGEAFFQLKYRNDKSKINVISSALCIHLGQFISSSCHIIIPMPPSKLNRRFQPVIEVARTVSQRLRIHYSQDLLVKTVVTNQMKDMGSRSAKIQALMGAFQVRDILQSGYFYDVLIIDDLFDTGSSLEAATNILRRYNKIRYINVVTFTWK